MCKLREILPPLGLAVVLAIGFGVVLALAAGWGTAVWHGLRQNRVVSENLEIRPDGTPVIQRCVYDSSVTTATYHGLDGRELPPVKGGNPSLGGVYLLVPRGDGLFRLSGDLSISRFYVGEAPSTNAWYFLHDGARDGRGYFVGYNYASKLCIGFIGRDGFRPDQPPVEQWFPIDSAKMAYYTTLLPYGFGEYGAEPGCSAGTVMMISGTQLLEVDLRSGSVKTIMESPHLIALGILQTFPNGKDAAILSRPYQEMYGVHLVRRLLVRTRDRIVVFGASEKQRTSFPIPEALRDRAIRLYELDAGKALLQASRNLPNGGHCEDLAWVDASRGVLRQAEVPLAAGNGRSDTAQAWTDALACPAPAMLAFGATVSDPRFLVANQAEPNYSAALTRCLAVWWPPFAAVTLLAAALAWYCCRRHRRYCQPASGVWFGFVLLAGVPGLVAYLCHRRWPVLEKCPACGHDVPRDREACARCGAAFPTAEPTGCEVFA